MPSPRGAAPAPVPRRTWQLPSSSRRQRAGDVGAGENSVQKICVRFGDFRSVEGAADAEQIADEFARQRPRNGLGGPCDGHLFVKQAATQPRRSLSAKVRGDSAQLGCHPRVEVTIEERP